MYGTQCNDIISNIVFIRMFFMLFPNKKNYNKIRLTENWNTYLSSCNVCNFSGCCVLTDNERGEGGGGGQTNVDRPGTREGVLKIPKFV